jgi:hypothetical protein
MTRPSRLGDGKPVTVTQVRNRQDAKNAKKKEGKKREIASLQGLLFSLLLLAFLAS